MKLWEKIRLALWVATLILCVITLITFAGKGNWLVLIILVVCTVLAVVSAIVFTYAVRTQRFHNNAKRQDILKNNVDVKNLVNLYPFYDGIIGNLDKYNVLNRDLAAKVAETLIKGFSVVNLKQSMYPSLLPNTSLELTATDFLEKWKGTIGTFVSNGNQLIADLKKLEKHQLWEGIYSAQGLLYIEVEWETIPNKVTQKPRIIYKNY